MVIVILALLAGTILAILGKTIVFSISTSPLIMGSSDYHFFCMQIDARELGLFTLG